MAQHTAPNADPHATRSLASNSTLRRTVLSLLVLAVLAALALVSGGGTATATATKHGATTESNPTSTAASATTAMSASGSASTVLSASASTAAPGSATVAADQTAATPVKHLTVSMGRYLPAVQLTVPRSWHVSRTAPSSDCGCGGPSDQVCIVSGGDYDHDPYRCELYVVGQKGYQTSDLPAPNWRLPACTKWSTIADSDTVAAGHPADYREFQDGCTGRRSEQWATVTDPQLIIWHPLGSAATDAAAARAAASATVEGTVESGRFIDEGVLRSATMAGRNEVRVSIDRVVSNLNGSLINRNHATYSYLVTPFGHTYGSTCATDLSSCTATQLVKQFRKGTHPADGSTPIDGALVTVYAGAAQGDSGWSIAAVHGDDTFSSTGDQGCGCS